MSKLEAVLSGDFDRILVDLDNVIMQSISATLEDISDFFMEDCRCSVRVYERYSILGNNRLSMTIMLLQKGDQIRFSAITSGGSSAILFKVNTVGESAFLDRIRGVISKYCIES